MARTQPCVLVGVTGCIAAYKSCEIVRALQKAGARVKVVMTEHATHFVDPTTFRALTHEPVATGLFDDPGDPIHHVSLAQECDVFLLAPCTANVLAKAAHGIADDLLTTTVLATTAPLVVAPAMNVHMYEAQATQDNLAVLRRRGARIVDAEAGYLACGDVGRGRLADVEDIVAATLDALEAAGRGGTERALAGQGALDTVAGAAGRDMAGLRVMLTAGPTVEPIDAVRYISNHSSGKMGYALARAAARRGAAVTLVSGPVSLPAPDGVRTVHIRTAREMLEAAQEAFCEADIAVFAAAVADVRPARACDGKLKKGRDDEALARIELVRNPDILATLASRRTKSQFVVGFAAETEDVVEAARGKLASKGADLIVGNEVGHGLGFGADDNKAWLVSASDVRELPLLSKGELADVVFDEVLARRMRGGRGA